MQMNRLEQDILSVLIIKPRLVYCDASWVLVVKDTHVGWLSKDLLTLHALNNFLCSVSMVYVEVNDGNAFNLFSVDVLQVGCCNSSVVDVAEAVCLLLVTLVVLESLAKSACVVAWRSNCTEGITGGARHHLFNAFDNGATT